MIVKEISYKVYEQSKFNHNTLWLATTNVAAESARYPSNVFLMVRKLTQAGDPHGDPK